MQHDSTATKVAGIIFVGLLIGMCLIAFLLAPVAETL